MTTARKIEARFRGRLGGKVHALLPFGFTPEAVAELAPGRAVGNANLVSFQYRQGSSDGQVRRGA